MATKRFLELFSFAASARGGKEPDLPEVQLWGGFSPRAGCDAVPSLGLCWCVRAPGAALKAGWTGHALPGTSSCLLRGTGMLLCVAMALL